MSLLQATSFSTTSTSSSNNADRSSSPLTIIRERTRNAIAQHRAWRHQPTTPASAATDTRNDATYSSNLSPASLDAMSFIAPAPIVVPRVTNTASDTSSRGSVKSRRSALPAPTTARLPQPSGGAAAVTAGRLGAQPRRRHGNSVLRDANTSRASTVSSNSAEDVYREIEAQERRYQQQALLRQRQHHRRDGTLPSSHTGKSQPEFDTSNSREKESSLSDSFLENHLQSLEHQFTSSPENSRTLVDETDATAATTATATAVRNTRHFQHAVSESERATIRYALRSSPRGMASSALPNTGNQHRPLQHMDGAGATTASTTYKPPHASPEMVFRDEGSVLTGLSQQELIRKKTRSTLRQQRKKQQRKSSNSKRKSKKNPIVQLPAALFALQPSARISSPQKNQQYYLPHSSINGDDQYNHDQSPKVSDEDKQIANRLAALRWNTNARSSSTAIVNDTAASKNPLPRSRNHQHPSLQQFEELDSFSTTAEITNASGESMPPPSPTLPRPIPATALLPEHLLPPCSMSSVSAVGTSRDVTCTAPIAARSLSAPFNAPKAAKVPLTSSPAVVSVRGDETLCIESVQGSLSPLKDDDSFPMLSKSFEATSGRDRSSVEHENAASHIDDNDTTTSVTERLAETTTERKGVRFANVIHEKFSSSTAGAGTDDWSEVPWDQKKDQQQLQAAALGSASTTTSYNSSPASVLDMPSVRTNENPKSILRSSRFKPDPLLAMRCRRALDFESERLLYTDDDFDSRQNKIDTTPAPAPLQQAAGVGKSGSEVGRIDANHPNPATSLQKARLGQGREINSSLEMSPPRHSGFKDREGIELSPIRAEGQREDISYVPGHPAEKHLREQMAMIREIRGGDIADQVIEKEQYPDPPMEINIDDDETVLSAYAFIETVAAIVVQTAVRQFLAALRVDSLRETRDALDLANKICSIERSTLTGEWSSQNGLSSAPDVVPRTGDHGVDTSETSEGDLDDIALNMFHLAAVQIQCVYRGFYVRDCLDVDHYCTTVLQRAYRGYACRKRVQHDIDSIITVQSWWRRNIARDEAANILAYAIAIQAVFRGHRVRKRYKMYQAKVTSSKWAAAVAIQWIWRGHTVRKRYKMFLRSEAQVRRAAAVVIQARWRSFVCEANFIRTLVDVLIVQTVVRRWLARGKVTTVKTSVMRVNKPQVSTTSLPFVRPTKGAHASARGGAFLDQHSRLLKPAAEVPRVERPQLNTTTHPIGNHCSGGIEGTDNHPIADPPGHLSACRLRNQVKKPASGLKSKVVARRMTDYDDGDGGCLENTRESHYGTTQSLDSTVNENEVEREKLAKASPIETKVGNQHRGGSSAGSTTSSLLSMWKEKEKRNACSPQNAGNGVSNIYRKG